MFCRLMQCFLLLCLLPLWPANASTLPPSIVEALERARLPADSLFVLVQDVAGGSPDLSWQADLPAKTASIMKVVTAQAALEILGPEYQFATDVHTTGLLSNGVLHGDLVLKGYGDPSLTIERIEQLLGKVMASGVSHIRGDIVVDNRYFQLPPFDPAAFDGAPFEPYNVGPDAMMLNYQATAIKVRATDAAVVQVIAEPASPDLAVVNDIKAIRGPCQGPNQDVHTRVVREGSRVILHLEGRLAVACGEKTIHMALLPPQAYTRDILRAIWQRLGGTLAGEVRPGALPPDAVQLIRHLSPPLATIVHDMNKWSNNVIARHLYLALGADGQAASLERSAQRLHAWLAERQLPARDLVLENGSGLSRVEQIPPATLGRLLLQALQGQTANALVSSLPVLGVDGTLRRRLVNTPLAGRAWLKSGTIRDVRGVAGFLRDRHGRHKVVVAIVNHESAGTAQSVLDEVLQWAYQ